MATDARVFIETMMRWREYFAGSADIPLIGATEAELSAIETPACILAGYDDIHPPRIAEGLHALMKHSELHHLLPEPASSAPPGYVIENNVEIGRVFVDFMRRQEGRPGD
jgi:hypothetical protein